MNRIDLADQLALGEDVAQAAARGSSPSPCRQQ
jgi:hypothetical protein